MSPNISPAQLTLLQHLHEHSGISGGRIGLDPRAVMRALRISMIRLAEDAAALAAHDLAGVRHVRPGADDKPSNTCSAIWVTRKGQDYLKRSRCRPDTAATPVE